MRHSDGQIEFIAKLCNPTFQANYRKAICAAGIGLNQQLIATPCKERSDLQPPRRMRQLQTLRFHGDTQ